MILITVPYATTPLREKATTFANTLCQSLTEKGKSVQMIIGDAEPAFSFDISPFVKEFMTILDSQDVTLHLHFGSLSDEGTTEEQLVQYLPRQPSEANSKSLTSLTHTLTKAGIVMKNVRGIAGNIFVDTSSDKNDTIVSSALSIREDVDQQHLVNLISDWIIDNDFC